MIRGYTCNGIMPVHNYAGRRKDAGSIPAPEQLFLVSCFLKVQYKNNKTALFN